MIENLNFQKGDFLELLATIIYLICAFYIYKTVAFVLIPYISEFFYRMQISRSEDGNQALAMITVIIITAIVTIFIMIFSYMIFRWFSVFVIIGLCIYIRVKDIGNPDT